MLNHEWTRRRSRRAGQQDGEGLAPGTDEPAAPSSDGLPDAAEGAAPAAPLTGGADVPGLDPTPIAARPEPEEAAQQGEEPVQQPMEPEPEPLEPERVTEPVLEPESLETAAGQDPDEPAAVSEPMREAEAAAAPDLPVDGQASAEQRVAKEVTRGLDGPLLSLRDRLEAVLSRQAQLPLDIEARQEVSEKAADSPRETREGLVQRLLDPTLTLEEVSMLLGVCRTTVRRYTDRGVLRCFRTPGNQRRFHLSDILDFMERQQRNQ